MRIIAANVLNLGDNLVFLPVVQALKRQFADADILVVTNEMAAEMYDPSLFMVATARKVSDRHVSFWKRPGSLLRLVHKLRCFKPDVALIAHAQPNAIHVACALSGAKIRVGGIHERLARVGRPTHGIALDSEKNVALQAWDLYSLMCTAMGVAEIPTIPPRPDLSHCFENTANVCEVVIHPGGSQEYRRWSLENYLHLAERLAVRWKVRFIWESPSIPCPPDTRNLEFYSAPNLRSLVNGMRRARLFVGNNSGPMHTAIALEIPAVVISGPTAKIWDPYWGGEKNSILQDLSLSCLRCEPILFPINRCINLHEPIACMRRWTVDKVFRRCEETMAGNKGHSEISSEPRPTALPSNP